MRDPFSYLDHLIQILQSIPLRKMAPKIWSTNSDLSHASVEDYIVCLGYPNKKVQKQIRKILSWSAPTRFPASLSQNDLIQHTLTPQELYNLRSFTVSFLDSHDYEVYRYARKMIKRAPQVFEPLLLDLLIHPNDALGINAMKILTEEFPKKYLRAELTSIFGVISMERKDQFFHDLVQQLDNFNDSWADRQAIFIKLGALHFSAVGKVLQPFAHDPDPDCRLTLATILAHIKSPEAVYTLYALLLDPKTQIRDTAAKSLGDLLPGLYMGKSSHEILESLDINELLDLLLPPPFPDHVKRVFSKLGFDPILLEQNFTSSDASLVEIFIQNTLRGTANGIKSLLTLLCRHMPQIETYLDTTIQQEADPIRKHQLHHTLEAIHNEFKIPVSNGFELYL